MLEVLLAGPQWCPTREVYAISMESLEFCATSSLARSGSYDRRAEETQVSGKPCGPSLWCVSRRADAVYDADVD